MDISHIRKIKTTDVRNNFGEIVDQVAIAKSPVIVQRRGRNLAVIIPIEEFLVWENLIQKEEDRMDLETARKFLKDRSKLIPYEKIRKELKLDEPENPIRAPRRKAAAAAARGNPPSRKRKIVTTRVKSASARRGKS